MDSQKNDARKRSSIQIKRVVTNTLGEENSFFAKNGKR